MDKESQIIINCTGFLACDKCTIGSVYPVIRCEEYATGKNDKGYVCAWSHHTELVWKCSNPECGHEIK